MSAAKVKSILSGDTLVLSTPNGEKQLSLAFVSAPRISANEPYGFESREYLRSLLIGKPVKYTVLYEVNDRTYGDVSAPIFKSLIVRALSAGSVKLREDASSKNGFGGIEAQAREAQAEAEDKKIGLFGKNIELVRIETTVPESLPGSHRQVPSVIERVLSGNRFVVRTLMDKDHHYVGPALLAGVQVPRTSHGDKGAEPFGDAARLFVEQKLLQRSVRLVYLGMAPHNPELPLVKVLHAAGDIAEALTGSGLATPDDRQTPVVGSEVILPLRAAETRAKIAGINMWKSLAAQRKTRNASEYSAIVTRVVSSDTVGIQALQGDQQEKTVQLSSVRSPRRKDPENSVYVPDAKEYARDLLIGKQVLVHVDGVQPESEQTKERELVTLSLDNKNVGLEIISAGWATAVRHRRDDPLKSPFIDELLIAEQKAVAAKKGMHAKPPSAFAKVVNASESVVRANGYLSSLQRRTRVKGIVDYVSSASRLRVIVPSENCIITAVLAGIRAPRTNEPHGEEAYKLVESKYLQRTVQISCQKVDKTGSFVSIIYPQGKKESLNVHLAALGFAELQEGSANASGLRDDLDIAIQGAKDSKLGIWQNYEEPLPLKPDAEEPPVAKEEGLNSYKDAYATSITGTSVSYQLLDAHRSFQKLSSDLKEFFTASVNSAAHTFEKQPRRGEVVVLKNEDGTYLRAKVLRFDKNLFSLSLLDLGKEADVDSKALLPLPSKFNLSSVPVLASSMDLALIASPPHDYANNFNEFLRSSLLNKSVAVRKQSPSTVILYTQDSKTPEDSINRRIIEKGLSSLVFKGSGPEFEALSKLQETAMKERTGIWEYGDLRQDEADDRRHF